MMRRLTIAFIVMGLLTACKVGPNYNRPGVPAPTVYRGVPNPAAPPDPQTLAERNGSMSSRTTSFRI
jgi:hypothetical protein